MTEVMQKLCAFFEANDDLSVFGMNGSKINVNIPDDIFKDYDVVFFTTDVKKYSNDSSFLELFGTILIKTEPETEPNHPEEMLKEKEYIYLVQYESGLRIDFQFRDISLLTSYLKEDSLTEIIADKEGRISTTILPSDSDYWLRKPTSESVLISITEFWWLIPNILKATLRDQLLLAEFYLDLTRKELFQLIAWSIANEEGWDKNYGKELTLLLTYLSSEEKLRVMSLFNTGSVEQIYQATLEMIRLQEEYQNTLPNEFLQHQMTALNQYKEIPVKYLISKGEDKLAAKFKLSEPND